LPGEVAVSLPEATAWTRLEKSSYPEELFSRKRAKESSAISLTIVTIAIAEHFRGQICEAGAAGVACGLPIRREEIRNLAMVTRIQSFLIVSTIAFFILPAVTPAG